MNQVKRSHDYYLSNCDIHIYINICMYVNYVKLDTYNKASDKLFIITFQMALRSSNKAAKLVYFGGLAVKGSKELPTLKFEFGCESQLWLNGPF